MPWILVTLAFVLFLPALEQFNPQHCFNESLTYDREPGTTSHNDRIVSWDERTTLLPSGQICGVASVNGKERTIENRSWLPPIAVALSLAVFLIGWIRPPTSDWRHLAIFLTAPAVMLGLFCLMILGDEGQIPESIGQVSFVALAFIGLGLIPGFVKHVLIDAIRDLPTRRVAWFFICWVGWSRRDRRRVRSRRCYVSTVGDSFAG